MVYIKWIVFQRDKIVAKIVTFSFWIFKIAQLLLLHANVLKYILKIFERHLENNAIIRHSQHGFTKG